MKQHPAVSIIVPTLNEAESLPCLFERIDTAMVSSHIPYEIIVVDDHSSDATYAVTKQAAKRYPVAIETKRGKRGKAYSLLQGFKAARHDIICMIDADLQYPPEAIPSMYHKMQFCNADVVITNRVDNETSLLRKIASGAFHVVFTRALFGISYDTQSGLKLFKKQVLNSISIAPSAWTFDLEFIVRALESKFTVLSEDIPFGKRYAGEAKINLASAAFEGAWQSLKLWRNTSVRKIRLQYKHLQPLQRSSASAFASFAGLLIAASCIITFAHAPSAHALSVPAVPVVAQTVASAADTDPLTGLADSVLGSTPTDISDPSTTSPTGTTLPSTGGTAPTAGSTAATGTSTSKSTAATQSSTNTPTANSLKSSTASKTSTGKAGSTASNDPSVLTAQSGKNAAYYPRNKLSSTKTNKFLELSTLILEIGGILVILAIVITSIKKIRTKARHSQPIWN